MGMASRLPASPAAPSVSQNSPQMLASGLLRRGGDAGGRAPVVTSGRAPWLPQGVPLDPMSPSAPPSSGITPPWYAAEMAENEGKYEQQMQDYELKKQAELAEALRTQQEADAAAAAAAAAGTVQPNDPGWIDTGMRDEQGGLVPYTPPIAQPGDDAYEDTGLRDETGGYLPYAPPPAPVPGDDAYVDTGIRNEFGGYVEPAPVAPAPAPAPAPVAPADPALNAPEGMYWDSDSWSYLPIRNPDRDGGD